MSIFLTLTKWSVDANNIIPILRDLLFSDLTKRRKLVRELGPWKTEYQKQPWKYNIYGVCHCLKYMKWLKSFLRENLSQRRITPLNPYPADHDYIVVFNLFKQHSPRRAAYCIPHSLPPPPSPSPPQLFVFKIANNLSTSASSYCTSLSHTTGELFW